ncbi:hypothetical protein ACTWP5_22440 [Streptomyces sp. 4N509B]|uniref:hypothetical protein n=1 Tax=Streptomyces sp. 4N509B TaxID=3457413 RepID=UPI003FCF21ED
MKTSWAAGLARLRPGSVARAENMLHACVRECARHLAAVSPARPPGPNGTALLAAIGGLVVEHTAAEPDEDRSHAALLATGRAALDAGETRLARHLADTAVVLRSRSRGAWRLRGDVLHAAGRDREALDAYERYEALGGSDRAILRRRETLADQWAALATAGRIVPEARLAEQPPRQLQEVLAGAVEQRLTHHGSGDPDTRRLADSYATYTRLAGQGRVEDPLLGGSEPIGVGPLRSQLKGRNVCVVANGEAVAASGLGEEIDAYDLVVRLDSFQAGQSGQSGQVGQAGRAAAGTGTRLHLHAVSHRCAAPGAWRRPAEIRLVFGDKPVQWRDAVRHRLVPGAQTYVGDKSLARPVRDAALIGEPGWAADATTGFTVVRLLDFLDVSPRIDLIGFSQPGQLRPEERQWVLAHARHSDSDGMRIALR